MSKPAPSKKSPGRKRLGTHPMTPAERQRRSRRKKEIFAAADKGAGMMYSDYLEHVLARLEGIADNALREPSGPDGEKVLDQINSLLRESRSDLREVEKLLDGMTEDIETKLPLGSRVHPDHRGEDWVTGRRKE